MLNESGPCAILFSISSFQKQEELKSGVYANPVGVGFVACKNKRISEVNAGSNLELQPLVD